MPRDEFYSVKYRLPESDSGRDCGTNFKIVEDEVGELKGTKTK